MPTSGCYLLLLLCSLCCCCAPCRQCCSAAAAGTAMYRCTRKVHAALPPTIKSDSTRHSPAHMSATAAATAQRGACCQSSTICPGLTQLQKLPGSSRIYSTGRDQQWYSGGDEDAAGDGPISYRGRSNSGRRPYNNSNRNDTRAGDWVCPECGDSNFARRWSCRQCNTPRPDSAEQGTEPRAPRAQREYQDRGQREYQDRGQREYQDRGQSEFRAGDWNCSSCGEHNYARRVRCYRCGQAAPEGIARPGRTSSAVQGPQDWTCPECGDLNFARRKYCRACDTPRPGGDRERGGRESGDRERPAQREYLLKDGDWTCADCGDVNFAFRTECRKCNAPKP